ncbi:bZIP transcription factor [Sporosarcina sp. ACRSL]|uniref:bZIP transcription factor n=1 Tax=Sporosarcina sp. ACRSL TaxID=2918215 RepID=UPI001EF5D200|nr:bZIP transcription factor [Sporosarcina sp. ACRSL]MCG7346103.1 bZIP transcription factor [Sporosarcina sp. ACRSL]
MQRSWFITSLLVLLIASGCTPDNTEIEALEQKVHQLEGENRKLKTDLENTEREYDKDRKIEDFTYLEELSDSEIEKYIAFLKDAKITHLKDISQEHIVLIFMNLIKENEVDNIFALTYDNGNLPSKEVFISEYNDYLAYDLEQEYLKYRYYDSVSVYEESQKDNLTTVGLTISFGSSSQTSVYALKKDQDVWEMDIYHLIELKKEDRK